VIVYPMERLDIEIKAENPGKWFPLPRPLSHDGRMAGVANLIIVD